MSKQQQIVKEHIPQGPSQDRSRSSSLKDLHVGRLPVLQINWLEPVGSHGVLGLLSLPSIRTCSGLRSAASHLWQNSCGTQRSYGVRGRPLSRAGIPGLGSVIGEQVYRSEIDPRQRCFDRGALEGLQGFRLHPVHQLGTSSFLLCQLRAHVSFYETASPRRHSPTLVDIAAFKTWDKLNSGPSRCK